MMWAVFFVITIGLAMLAAREQCHAEDMAATHRQLAREFDL